MADNSITHFDILSPQLIRKDIYFSFFCRADATRISLEIWNDIPGGGSSLKLRQLTPELNTTGTTTTGGIEIDRGFHLFAWDCLSDYDNNLSSSNNYQIVTANANPVANGIYFQAEWSSPLTSYLSSEAQGSATPVSLL